MDKNGKLVIDFLYYVADPFSDVLAAVEIDGYYQFIDKNGKVVITNQYMSVDKFVDGKAFVIPRNSNTVRIKGDSAPFQVMSPNLSKKNKKHNRLILFLVFLFILKSMS